MIISQIERIGIAVKNIDDVLPFYEEVLGFKCYAKETIEEQKVTTSILKIGEVKIKLLEPTADDSPISVFFEKEWLRYPPHTLQIGGPT